MERLEVNWEKLSPEEKKKSIVFNAKKTLDMFLERNAISKSQYDSSLNYLIEKMNITDL